jgi:hypothetical protein
MNKDTDIYRNIKGTQYSKTLKLQLIRETTEFCPDLRLI